jgi:hypothetical protein
MKLGFNRPFIDEIPRSINENKKYFRIAEEIVSLLSFVVTSELFFIIHTKFVLQLVDFHLSLSIYSNVEIIPGKNYEIPILKKEKRDTFTIEMPCTIKLSIWISYIHTQFKVLARSVVFRNSQTAGSPPLSSNVVSVSM